MLCIFFEEMDLGSTEKNTAVLRSISRRDIQQCSFFFPSDLPPDRIPRALPGPDPARVRLLHEGGDGLGPVRVGPQDQAGAAEDAALVG